MKKLAALIAIPFTASLAALMLWSKLVEAYDNTLLLDLDFDLDDPIFGTIDFLEGTTEANRHFNSIMWDYYMEQAFNEDG